MTKVINCDELVKKIKSNSTIGLSGFGGMGQCDTILKHIRKSFLKYGSPNNLTIFHNAGQSDGENGIELLAIEGLIKRVIGGHWGLAPKIRNLMMNNKIEAYCFPQGQLVNMYRTISQGLPGHLSPIGLNTFVDPRIEGGKVNDKTKLKEDLVKIVTIEDEDFLYYKSIEIDYVFIRGTTADEDGNIVINDEPLKLGLLAAAQAAKACNGKVVVQVKNLAKKGEFHPKDIAVPGHLIDYIIITDNIDKEHRQTPNTIYDPVYTGDIKAPIDIEYSVSNNNRATIGRRAIRELRDNIVINMGIGIPGDTIGPFIHEHKLNNQLTTTVESGIIGGIPMGGNEFGVARNPDTIMEHLYMFDYYHGTGVDITFMGAAEIDRFGNVNVSKFGNRSVGCGGFIDITQNAKKIVFCTTFTVNGLKTTFDGQKLSILREGQISKFVEEVNQITYSVNSAFKKDQEVIYITERAVFTLTEKGLELIEIAPGIDIERNILPYMKFTPKISKDLKVMDKNLFKDSYK